MRVHVPLILSFLAGMFFLVQFFMPHQAMQSTYEELVVWLQIIFAFSIVLGITSLVQRHLSKIRRREVDWPYSIITLVSFAGVLVVGIWKGQDPGSPFAWVYDKLYTPLDATMFSLLAFFVASAAYRTFRARTTEATVLLVTALIVMVGRVPLGEMISAKFPLFTEWLMSVPTMAAKRAIVFGAALGGTATALRIILGIERSHLGQ
jgi:hypothetical protein